MSKRAASPEISLFPFLSILVCVIGSLVSVVAWVMWLHWMI